VRRGQHDRASVGARKGLDINSVLVDRDWHPVEAAPRDLEALHVSRILERDSAHAVASERAQHQVESDTWICSSQTARKLRESYRRVRGSPNCGKTLLPPNHVIADIRSPSSVSTNSAYARAISVWGLGK
jgi:hypothetical protein